MRKNKEKTLTEIANPNETKMLRRMAEFPASVLKEPASEVDDIAIKALEKMSSSQGPNPYAPYNFKMPEDMKKTLEYFKSAEMTDYDDFDEALKKVNIYTDKIEDLYPSMNKASGLTKLKDYAMKAGKGLLTGIGKAAASPITEAALMALEPSELDETEDDKIMAINKQLKSQAEMEDPSNLMKDIENFGDQEQRMSIEALKRFLASK